MVEFTSELIVYASEWVQQEHLGAYLEAFGFNAEVQRYNGARPGLDKNAYLITGHPATLDRIYRGLTGKWIWSCNFQF